MRKLNSDLDEMKSFLDSWRPEFPSFDDPALRPQIKTSYKQFHAVLIWGLAGEDEAFGSAESRQFLTEAISDLSHAYLLNLSSLYKGSRASLRSSIENYIRVACLSAGVEVKPIKSLFELFQAAKDAYSSDKIALQLITSLHQNYGELCKSVHSAKLDYLALAVPFEKMSLFSAKQFSENNEKIRSTSAQINQLAFWLWDDNLNKVGHENADFVRDSLPKSLKRSKSL